MGKAVEVVLDIVVFLATVVGLAAWFIVLSPLYFSRVIVILLAKCFKSETFDVILSPLDLFFYSVLERRFEQAPEAFPCGTLSLDGHLNFDDFKANIMKNFLEIERNGRSLYNGRFQQHVRIWLGFAFYEWHKNFDISNHVILIENADETEPNRCRVIMNMTRKPFRPESSPWEIQVYPYFKNGSPKTLLAVRVHHTVGDGRSLLKMLARISDQQESENLPCMPQIQTVSIAEKLKRFYQFNIALPRAFIKRMGKASNSPGVFRDSSTANCEQVLVAETTSFSLALFKSLGRDAGVPFTAVLTTALLKGICYLNMVKGHRSEKTNGILEFHGMIPIPRPNRPEGKPVNHFYLSNLSMISGPDSTAAERLKRNTENLSNTKVTNLQFAVAHTIFVNIICTLPVFISRRFRAEKRQAFLISNLCGPEKQISILNNSVLDLVFWVPNVSDNGIFFSVISYNGFVRIGLCIDKNLAGEQNTLDEMVKIIENELNEMFSIVNV